MSQNANNLFKVDQRNDHAYYQSVFQSESTNDPIGQAMLIQKQKEMIELYRQTSRDRDEIINHLKRLVNLQEEQIVDLKLKLRQLREKQ